MSKNISELPFTEIVERAGELGRERVDVRSKLRGIINDVYTREIPRKFDWNFFLVTSSMTFTPEYATGTIAATTGLTAVTFTGSVLTQSNNAMKLKVQGNDFVYDFTYVSNSSGTISPPFSGIQNAQGAPFSLFQPFYSLPTDFDRFPKNGGLIDYQGGTEQRIEESAYPDWVNDYVSGTSDVPQRCRISGMDTAGNFLLEINPAPKNAKSVRNDYYYRPRPMRETTAGNIVSVAAGGTAVVGDATTRFMEATTGDYFRINNFGQSSDSEWYRIIAISGNSGLTLQTAFGLSGATSASYTICSAPQMPYRMHPAVLYGSLLQLAADQDDRMFQAYNVKLAEVLSDGKRVFTTRIYNQDIHHLGEEYLYRR